MKKICKRIWKHIEKSIVFFLSLLYNVLHKELPDNTISFSVQFIKFSIVGISNSIIFYGLYAASLWGFRKTALFEKDYLAAQMTAFCLSVLWSFYWNNKMVFMVENGERRIWWKALLKTYVSYSFSGLFLNSILLVLWIDVCHLSEYVAPVINLIIGVPVNFIINRFWTFK